MRRRRVRLLNNSYAVTELVGGLLIMAMAVIAFSAIYVYLYPPPPDVEFNTKIEGSVTEEGVVVLRHIGGETLSDYKVLANYPNGTSIGYRAYEDDNWKVSEKRYPLDGISDILLKNESMSVRISVYAKDKDGEEEKIFDGILTGRVTSYESIDVKKPMLISSLKTNSVDEDLICFNYTIGQQINAFTYIYNWLLDGSSITDLLLSFDTNKIDTTRDYSRNGNNGTINGPTWTTSGKVGGSYQFDGVDDYISIPYCHDGDYVGYITVEAWIKTSSSSSSLISCGEESYWQLGIKNGKVLWSTISEGDLVDVYSVSSVNDNQWHHIAASYDYSTGIAAIYIDGILDYSLAVHNNGDVLGDGTNPVGSIGLSTSISAVQNIFSTSFESESEEDKWEENDYRTTAYWWEDYVFERLASDSITPRTGSYSLGGSGDFDPRYVAFDREGIDISGYNNVNVSIWYSYKSTEGADDLGFYYWDGTDWEEIFEETDPDVGEGNQLEWTYAEVNIPDEIDNLILQFWWSSSSDREYVAIDDLQVTGISGQGLDNYSGLIDELKIYDRVLSEEQIYQNYLCSKDGATNKSIIVSDETAIGDIWQCIITPNNTIQDYTSYETNSIEIIGYGGG